MKNMQIGKILPDLLVGGPMMSSAFSHWRKGFISHAWKVMAAIANLHSLVWQLIRPLWIFSSLQESSNSALKKGKLTGYLEYLITKINGDSGVLEIITPEDPAEKKERGGGLFGGSKFKFFIFFFFFFTSSIAGGKAVF